MIVLLAALPLLAAAQAPAAEVAPVVFSQEQLDPLLAPVALYPDTLLTQASLGRYRGTEEAPQPVDGHFFRPLTGQGPNAAGGACEYLVKGRQIGRFALLATPARQGVSGVMSFIVDHDGAVFSKKLGPATTAAAARITGFNPDAGWKRETAP